jgi:iron complex transport system substrate-binding protein
MHTLCNSFSMMKACFPIILLLWLSLSGDAFAAPPERIVSLAPSITEILYDLGLEDRIVAVTTFCDYPPQVMHKPKVGGFANPSIEAIIAARPDLVIMTDDGNPREVYDRLKKLGINTYTFKAKRLSELPQGIRDLGVATGIQDQAYKRAKRIETELRKYKRRVQKSPPRYFNKKVIFIIQPEPLIVAGHETVIDDALKLLGLQNIAADTDERYPKYSMEEVIRRSPDVIFIGIGPMTREGSKNFLRRLKSLDAVRMGRVYYTSESLYRLTPRVIAGIEEIAGYLHGY